MAALLLHSALILCFLSNLMHAQVAEWKSATATYSTDSNDSMLTGIEFHQLALPFFLIHTCINLLQKVLVAMETFTKAMASTPQDSVGCYSTEGAAAVRALRSEALNSHKPLLPSLSPLLISARLTTPYLPIMEAGATFPEPTFTCLRLLSLSFPISSPNYFQSTTEGIYMYQESVFSNVALTLTNVNNQL